MPTKIVAHNLQFSHVRTTTPPDSTSLLFEVGVAFVGKRPPRSYEEDPSKRYEVGGTTPEQLNMIEDWVPTESASSDKRTQTRHNIPVDIVIESFKENGEVEVSEHSVAENISQHGAAI